MVKITIEILPPLSLTIIRIINHIDIPRYDLDCNYYTNE